MWLWVRSVEIAAQRPPSRFEEVLGEDGRWDGLWERYARGIVSPSPNRLKKIARVLPGTDRYYLCPIWNLLRTKESTWTDLRNAVIWLGDPFRSAFIRNEHSVNGHFWRSDFSPNSILSEATRLVSDPEHGLDALTSIALIVREAELRQDGWLYLEALKAWANIDNLKEYHPVLANLSPRVLNHLAEPLRYLIFSDRELNNYWELHREHFVKRVMSSHAKFDIVDALNMLRL